MWEMEIQLSQFISGLCPTSGPGPADPQDVAAYRQPGRACGAQARKGLCFPLMQQDGGDGRDSPFVS